MNKNNKECEKNISLQDMFETHSQSLVELKNIVEMNTLCIKKLIENQNNIMEKQEKLQKILKDGGFNG